MNAFFVLWDYIMSLLILPLGLVRALQMSDREFLDNLYQIYQ